MTTSCSPAKTGCASQGSNPPEPASKGAAKKSIFGRSLKVMQWPTVWLKMSYLLTTMLRKLSQTQVVGQVRLHANPEQL